VIIGRMNMGQYAVLLRRVCLAAMIVAFADFGAEAQKPLIGEDLRPVVDEAAVSGSASDDNVKMATNGTVDLHVSEMPMATLLRMLSLRTGRNIVATPAAVQTTVTADLQGVTFEKALKAVLTANNCDYELREDLYYVYTLDELAAMHVVDKPTTHRVFRLNYARARDISPVIELLLSEDGEIVLSPAAAVGVAATSTSAGGDALAGHDFIAVRDTPKRLATIAVEIAKLDTRPLEVLVEATILRVRLTEDNALGVDFSLLGGVDFEALGSTSVGIQNINVGALPQARFERFNSSITTNFTGAVPDGGVSVGVIKDHVAVFLRALEKVTDANVIANPKLLTLNKQVGNVIVGRRDGYLTTTVTDTTAIQKVEFLETGTQLTFRPFIGTDGYIRMELHPKDSIGGLTTAQLPFEQTTEVTTNVLVRDGNTILIGGLFREVNTSTRSQIPLLGDAPLFGDLFRSRNDSVEREEVIILLTVHIIKNDEVYAQHSAQVLEDIERARVGIRQGVMWHGRESLAQAYYHRAVELYASGDRDNALWNVQMATQNHPQLLPAIKLKEEIEQARDWDDDGGITRSFMRDLIATERGDKSPVFGRPIVQSPESSVPVGEDQDD